MTAEPKSELDILKDFCWLELLPRIRRLESNAGIDHVLPEIHPHRDPRWKYHPQPIIPDADPKPDELPGVRDAGHDRTNN